MSKSKVAPLKTLTLPILELLAAVVGSKLSKYVKDKIRLNFEQVEIILWSDSQIVLSWLSSKKSLPRIVESKVKRITSLTSGCEWKYCPTSSNPADLLTRGITAESLRNNALWFIGQPWLLEEQSQWPQWKQEKREAPEQFEEPINIMSNVSVENKTASILNAIDVENFSTIDKLSKVIAWVNRFKNVFKEEN